MSRYRRSGKQILCHNEHYADAVDELAAMQIVNALKAIEERVLRSREMRTPHLNLNTCRAMRQGDEMACSCGLRWDVDDPDPPRCSHRATS